MCVYRSTHSVAQVKTEHRKGEHSKTTCREICRYYINGKGQCEVIERKMEVIPELERNGFTGDLYGLAPLTMFKAILRDRSNLFACKARTAMRPFSNRDAPTTSVTS